MYICNEWDYVVLKSNIIQLGAVMARYAGRSARRRGGEVYLNDFRVIYAFLVADRRRGGGERGRIGSRGRLRAGCVGGLC